VAAQACHRWGYCLASEAIIGTPLESDPIIKLDAHTVKPVFKGPAPVWSESGLSQILPKHLCAEYTGQRAREAPYNLKPVGTGPYKSVDFKRGDVARNEINPHHDMPNRLFFDNVEMKGGGDATSAARAVIQTGELDFACNTLVDIDIRKQMEGQGRKSAFRLISGTSVERIQLNRNERSPRRGCGGYPGGLA
jgi:peptide/nickel transport system substrate-binding protein